jgi:hypothetical protein
MIYLFHNENTDFAADIVIKLAQFGLSLAALLAIGVYFYSLYLVALKKNA